MLKIPKTFRLLHNYRRLALLFADLLIMTVSFFGSFTMFYHRLRMDPQYVVCHWLLMLVTATVFLVVFRCYDSLWRYADGKEYLMQFAAIIGGFVAYFLLERFVLFSPPESDAHYSGRFSAFAFMAALVMMWVMRFIYRYLRQWESLQEYRHRETASIAIIGAGDAGLALIDEILHTPSVSGRVLGFFDDSPAKQGLQIRGVPVLGKTTELSEKLKGTDVTELIIAIPTLTEEGRREMLKRCVDTGLHVRILPRMTELVRGNNGSLWGSVRSVQPEDLLGREPVTFDNQEVYAFLSGKTVLVTGGGGSIGSELCRQIARQNPGRLIILDIYENNAYEIQQELRREYGDALPLSVEIASVRDRDKIDYLFRKYKPQIVFHAAAHKHVPLMEDCPEEAIKNNVFGTYNVASVAAAYGVERFVLISTDKAVNPTNVMGASKRMCEMVIQGISDTCDIPFVAVRFGNVLGSNGSVIPLFKRQIEKGGPVTVTDRRIIRYFMTIPEAAQLVMQAGAMADRSQVFVLDMGEPVRIWDLAENLIRLSGLTPYQDIDIVETGLRPGEKLYEELLMSSDTLTATKNHKIFIEQQEPLPHEQMEQGLENLRRALATESPEEIVRVMRQEVPTFRTPEEVNREAGDPRAAAVASTALL